MKRFSVISIIVVSSLILLYAIKPSGVRNITQSDFVHTVIGKTQDEVRVEYGQPQSIGTGFPGDETYVYSDHTTDAEGGKLVVVFTDYRAVSVRLEK
jgi:hypothetical protein